MDQHTEPLSDLEKQDRRQEALAEIESRFGLPRPSPTLAQAGAYQALFDYFNAELFGSRLPHVLLNLSRMAKAYGFFAPERWQHEESKLHEISLNPDHMAGRDPRTTASTLVHEMCHLEQREFGQKLPKRPYHNREFAKMMAAVGLQTSSTGAPGGKPTGVSMTHYIIDGGAFDRVYAALPPEILLPRLAVAKTTAAKKKRDSSKIKHTCVCGTNIWGKAGIRATCGECEQSFTAEEIDDDED